MGDGSLDGSVSTTPGERVEKNLEGMRTTLHALKDVFFATSDEETKRANAAKLLQTSVRGKMARKRYKQFKLSLKVWKANHSRELVQAAQSVIARQTKIDAKVKQLKVVRDMHMMQMVFGMWEQEMRLNQQTRHHIKKAVEQMETSQNQSWNRKVFRAWKSVVAGPASRKACRQRHEVRLAEARASLVARLAKEQGIATDGNGEASVGIISQEEVHEEMKRQLHGQMVQRRRFHAMRQHFRAMWSAVEQSRRNMRDAIEHHRLGVLVSIFYPWTEWTYLHSTGLDRRQYKGPRRYEVPYNLKRVETFYRRRILRMFLPPWREIAKVYGVVRKMARAQRTRFARNNLLAWKERSNYQRGLRRGAVDLWKETSMMIVALPFRAWFLYMDKMRREREDQQRLINQHTRLKTRQLMWKILRTWRHQAVFGRVEGLYSRTELMRSLAEQKQHSKALEYQSQEYTTALDAMNKMLDEEHDHIEEKERAIAARDDEIANLKMALHNAEHDMIRVSAVLESVAQVHPAMTNHIVMMQPEFGFKNRQLVDLAKVAVENNVKAAKRRKATEERALSDLARAQQLLDDAETEPRRKLANRAIDEAKAELEAVRQEALEVVKTMGVPEEALEMAAKLKGGGIGSGGGEENEAKEDGNQKDDPGMAIKRSVTAPAAMLDKSKAEDGRAGGVDPLSEEGGADGGADAAGGAAAGEGDVQRAHTLATPGMPMDGGGPASPSRRASDPPPRNLDSPGLDAAKEGAATTPEGGRARASTMPPQMGDGVTITIPTATGSTVGSPGGKRKNEPPPPPSPMGKLEAEALSRLQFCLKQVNFRDVRQLAGEDLYAFDNDSTTHGSEHSEEEEEDSKDPYEVISKQETQIDSLREELTALYGTFEFLKTGNSNALPKRCVNQWIRHEKDKTGGYAGRNWDQLTQGGEQKGHTWNDFLLQIRAKMPGTRKTLTVEDKMSRRITDSYARSQKTQAGLYGQDKTTFAINPYAMQPIDDDFKPGTPREWAHELNENDVVLTPGDLYKTMSYGTPNLLFNDDDGSVSVHTHDDSTV